jgi:5-methylthioadenosine/S-adenosylhomocysteine deaminase
VTVAQDLLIEGGTVVTVDATDRVFVGDVWIRDKRIAGVGPPRSLAVPPGTRTLNARGCIVCPGFVQVHVHLCQALFRGAAEERALLPWLSERIWPLEGAHDAASLRTSAELGIAELLLGGTTTALDMGTVRHGREIFGAAARMGIRLVSGKTHMDVGSGSLVESTDASVKEACLLADEFHGAADGRLHYAFAPRFILSCSPALMQAVAHEARQRGCLLHTHASESPGELDAVRAATGKDNIIALHDLGLTGSDVVLAHCVWLNDAEQALLARTNTVVAHCPSTNLKLASGIARIPELLSDGIRVAIGADGAPCNNRLSAFTEMRLASLLQKPRLGAMAMPAAQVMRMMTQGGADALGLGRDIGSLEVGKRADVTVVDLQRPHLRPTTSSPLATLVYAAEAGDVRDVFVDGAACVRNGRLVRAELAAVLDDADRALLQVAARAGIANP